MPTKAPTNCTKPGCNGLIRNNICGGCGKKRGGRDRVYDAGRGTAAQRGYDSNWQRVRRMQLAREPLCRDCKKKGTIVAGTEVHHIIAKRDGGINEFDNLMTLCKTCHSKRTAKGE